MEYGIKANITLNDIAYNVNGNVGSFPQLKM